MADRQSTRRSSEDTREADRPQRAGRPQRAVRRPREDREDREDQEDRGRASGTRLTAGDAGREALQQIGDLTGKELEGVSGVRPTDDGWTVMVDVVEDRKIPSTSDVIATYEAELDPDGELLSYRRIRRYTRGRGDDGVG